MSSDEYIGFLLVMRDVLPLAAKLSKIFQGQDCDLSVLHSLLPAFLEEIGSQIDTAGINFSTLENLVVQIESEGLHVRRSPGRNNSWLESTRKKDLASLRDQLNNQFPKFLSLPHSTRFLIAINFPNRRRCLPVLWILILKLWLSTTLCTLSLRCKTLMEWPMVRRWLWEKRASEVEVEILQETEKPITMKIIILLKHLGHESESEKKAPHPCLRWWKYIQIQLFFTQS
eukprot:Pompholyxophrys_punicea_v1_NODE_20_length_5743_cov_10.121371.p1 type:complete len:229 gc:universal NODE_20_length_5743_cov_10.121371:4793-5479(+)